MPLEKELRGEIDEDKESAGNPNEEERVEKKGDHFEKNFVERAGRRSLMPPCVFSF